jgi:hypothetical protein
MHATSTTLDMAVSSSLLLVGCAIDFSCTVESTIKLGAEVFPERPSGSENKGQNMYKAC